MVMYIWTPASECLLASECRVGVIRETAGVEDNAPRDVTDVNLVMSADTSIARLSVCPVCRYLTINTDRMNNVELYAVVRNMVSSWLGNCRCRY